MRNEKVQLCEEFISDVNGTFPCARAAKRALHERGGRVVNMCASCADRAVKHRGAHYLEKHGEGKPMPDRNRKIFDEAFYKAENALRKRDGPKRAKTKKPEFDGDISKLSTHVDKQLVKLRADMNDVLHTLQDENKNGVKSELVVKSAAGDLIGKHKGVRHHQFETLVRAVETRGSSGHRKNILLKGPMGGGKSTAGADLSKLLGLEFSYTGQTLMPHDVVGGVNQVTNEFRTTPFVEAFTNGGVWMAEEMDGWSANATLVLNPALANGWLVTPDGKFRERHKDFVCIACANTWGTGATSEYIGRNRLDAAFLDRFAYRIEWQYDENLERLAAGDDEVVEAVQLCRFNAKKAGLKVNVSMRASIDIADMVRAGFSMREAMDMNFLAGCDVDQKRTLLDGVF